MKLSPNSHPNDDRSHKGLHSGQKRHGKAYGMIFVISKKVKQTQSKSDRGCHTSLKDLNFTQFTQYMCNVFLASFCGKEGREQSFLLLLHSFTEATSRFEGQDGVPIVHGVHFLDTKAKRFAEKDLCFCSAKATCAGLS